MGKEKICSLCDNLSKTCPSCGGTEKSYRKKESGYSICPACNNQSDYCSTCGGNIKNAKSDEDREEDEAWGW